MKTVLIVDDSSVVRMSLNYFLKENDFNVIEAVDGKDGRG
jgi:DNA-binding response OmpR family regulator